MFIAIGLLAPHPRLIAISLWHQRKLPYWFTKVCYSHQLKPNLAYSPQGRLLRKRRDSVFRCGYDCTPLHPRPPLGGETRTSRYKPSNYYRLSSVSCTLGARRQDWVLGTMGFALHRDANFSRFKLILVEIATTRLIQRRVISYRLLQGRFNQLSGITVQMLILVAVSAFIYLVYILYQIFFKKSNLFHKSIFIVHRSKSLDIFMSHNAQKEIIAINFFNINASGISSNCRTTFRTS